MRRQAPTPRAVPPQDRRPPTTPHCTPPPATPGTARRPAPSTADQPANGPDRAPTRRTPHRTRILSIVTRRSAPRREPRFPRTSMSPWMAGYRPRDSPPQVQLDQLAAPTDGRQRRADRPRRRTTARRDPLARRPDREAERRGQLGLTTCRRPVRRRWCHGGVGSRCRWAGREQRDATGSDVGPDVAARRKLGLHRADEGLSERLPRCGHDGNHEDRYIEVQRLDRT